MLAWLKKNAFALPIVPAGLGLIPARLHADYAFFIKSSGAYT
jgi:hypothetical protein